MSCWLARIRRARSCSAPDGLQSQVTKAVLERALAEEVTEHLGYDRHDPGPATPST
jgi:putative transposase